MMSTDFARDEMYEPIERMFEREFPGEFAVFEVIPPARRAEHHIGLAYVQNRRESLHVVRLEESYVDCLFDVRHGIHRLGQAEGNFRWIGLPLGDFRDGEAQYNDMLIKLCRERGLGIITIQQKGLGVSAKVILDARRESGDALAHYPALEARWTAMTAESLVNDEFRVVSMA